MMKRFAAALLTMALLVCGFAGAVEVPKVQNDTYVYDEAGVIPDDVETKLNSELRSLEEDTSAEFFVVTVAGLDGMAIEDFGYDVGNEMGIGQAEYNNGLLLLVSVAERTRNVRIEVGRGMEGIFNDAKVGRILDEEFVPSRDTGDYETAIVKTAERLIAETRENSEWVGVVAESVDGWVVAVAFGVVGLVVGLMMFALYREGKRAMKKKGTISGGFWQALALGMMINNSRGRSRRSSSYKGRGGFGGGGSGGGFSGGGSGGGSFGGGGATR